MFSKYIYIALAAVIAFLSFQVFFLKKSNEHLQEEKGQLTSRVEVLKGNIKTQNDAVDNLKKASDDLQKKLDKAGVENRKISDEAKKRQKIIDDFKIPTECPDKIEWFKIKLMEFANGD